MGAGQSSFPQYSNDFELVIRVSKELEHTLRTKILHRSATTRPGDSEPSLMEMINQVEDLFSRSTIQEMRGLVRLRNKMVHDYEYNELSKSQRAVFYDTFQQVQKELEEYIRKLNGSHDDHKSSCIVS